MSGEPGTNADGRKPSERIWETSQRAAASAAVGGSLLVGAPAAGTATSNTIPAAQRSERNERISLPFTLCRGDR
jgi:hypothetical protein